MHAEKCKQNVTATKSSWVLQQGKGEEARHTKLAAAQLLQTNQTDLRHAMHWAAFVDLSKVVGLLTAGLQVSCVTYNGIEERCPMQLLAQVVPALTVSLR